MASSPTTIYILYNANASILGKLDYAWRKLTAASDSSPCAACDLTHGGLKLDESALWKKTKERIDVPVKQLHQDELDPKLREFVSSQNLRYPVVLGQTESEPIKVLLDSESLPSVASDHEAFLSLLKQLAAMFDIFLRRVKDRVFRPIVFWIPKWVRPGHITLLSFISGFVACTLASGAKTAWVAKYPWVLNRFLDCLDGALARERGLTSESGGFFDLLSDFVIYSYIPIAVSWGQYNMYGQRFLNKSSFSAIAVLEASFHINNFVLFYSAAVAADKDDRELTSIPMKPAFIEGFESGLIFTAMLVFPDFVVSLAWMMSAGVAIGIVQRICLLEPVLARLDGQQPWL